MNTESAAPRSYPDTQHYDTSADWQHDRPPHPTDLINHFGSIKEIVEDKDGKVKVLAKAMDMGYADCANLLIDQYATIKGVLRQKVEISVDGQQVALKHPHTGNNLTYADILTDRSGPKFGGYLQHGPGEEFLELSPEERANRESAKTQQMEAARNVAEELGGPQSEQLEKMLTAAVAAFDHPHPIKRRLSDFDLEMADFNLLCQAIGQEIGPVCQEKSGKPLSRELQFEVALTHWLYGGDINTDLVAHAARGEGQYSALVKAAMQDDPGNVKPHWLAEAPGKAIQAMMEEAGIAADPGAATAGKASYKFGPAVGFHCKLLAEKDGKLVVTNTIDELCDVIKDSGLDFEPTLTKGLLDQEMINHLHKMDGVTPDQIDAAMKLQQDGDKAFDFVQLTRDLEKNAGAPEEALTTLREEYRKKNSFRESSLMMQETAHKLALSENQDEHKWIGNIADTGKLLANIQQKVDAGDVNATAQQQLLMLSYMATLPKWGIHDGNLNDIGTFAKGGDPQGEFPQRFADSISERSYASEGGAREAVGWTGMNEGDATRYLESFENGAKPVFDFAKDQTAYFEAMKNFGVAFNEYKAAATNADPGKDGMTAALDQAGEKFLEAHAELHGSIVDILQSDKMQALRESLEMNGEDAALKLDELAQGLTSKSVQAVTFNERRAALAEHKEVKAEKTQTAAEVMETSNPIHLLNKLFAQHNKAEAGVVIAEESTTVSSPAQSFPVLPKVSPSSGPRL